MMVTCELLGLCLGTYLFVAYGLLSFSGWKVVGCLADLAEVAGARCAHQRRGGED